MKPSVLVRFFAWLRGGRVVWLRDFEGSVYESIATADPFGVLTCPVYWFVRIGHCNLLPDGKVDPRSRSCYVETWKYA